ncbi:nucleotidyl transferase AbiEii/AbiGii toxin family protein [Flavobacterium sp. ZT3R18]|uniref:nucleotidyl transferase AbiEii/AbiGii toxin family protein n=1 Tax=Flavobacterium sp. ZT3R18 TaxID=2594429 RepID=UPI00117A1D0C|nr:nucleotidyl transferase AbiEii/AbiGii toxin family protein [Flavobacterium sp. ZT3R18]TRX30445.1 nucleotidyl transferase AbiEii/AbiGii toxin family protein [Flavobacterium sp. ZT3R18]
MSAVSPAILKTIQELQSLSSLSDFALGGGTNLALQFNHRISDDIDLFCPDIIGKAGFKQIEDEVLAFYGNKASRFDNPCDINDQFTFLRFFINIEDGVTIKIELLQNMKNLYPIEIKDNIRLLSKRDIGLFKLVSAANRTTKKDIYDLDFITNEIPLVNLYDELKIKMAKYNQDKDRTIFDLEKHLSPIDNPQLLLKFDDVPSSTKLPSHSHDNIHIVEGNKIWAVSKIDWRTKVRSLYSHLSMRFPRPQGFRLR